MERRALSASMLGLYLEVFRIVCRFEMNSVRLFCWRRFHLDFHQPTSARLLRISQLISRQDRDLTCIQRPVLPAARCRLPDTQTSEPKAKVKLVPGWSTFGRKERPRNLSGESPVRSPRGIKDHSRRRCQCSTNAAASEQSWLSLHGKDRVLSRPARWFFGS